MSHPDYVADMIADAYQAIEIRCSNVQRLEHAHRHGGPPCECALPEPSHICWECHG